MPDSNVRWLENQHTPLPKSLTTHQERKFNLSTHLKSNICAVKGVLG